MSSALPLNNTEPIAQLIEIMQRLRSPINGCPWDLEQTFETIAPYTIEEAYEVLDAIQRNNMNELKEELGDLFLQVVFHSQMAEEAGHFSIQDVAASIVDKLVRRHPHVFASEHSRTSDEQTQAWEDLKALERSEKSDAPASSALDGVALALPALLRAEKLQKRAARVGFDWEKPEHIFSKMDEEIAEVKEAISIEDPTHIKEEIGDLLFVCANLARKLNIDPETALREANDKFERRFRSMEGLAANKGQDFSALDLETQESLWQDVKKTEPTIPSR